MIEFGPGVEEAIRKHGELAYPEECCGLLLGRLVGELRRVVGDFQDFIDAWDVG
jgi:proteasome lid subunit RPN8/RPN11